jgi:4'-phosphopantetheinyl transferase
MIDQFSNDWPMGDVLLNRPKTDEVLCWKINLKDISTNDLEGYYQHISKEDQVKSNKFVHFEDKKRYIVARMGIKILLKNLIDTDYQIEKNAFGKPYVKNSPIKYNLSHSGNFVLLAVSSCTEVGVDVEVIRDIPNLESLFLNTLHINEISYIKNLAPALILRNFLQIWTQKEAVVKALGKGLSIPLESFSIPGLAFPSPPKKFINIFSENLTIFDLNIDDNHVGALAVCSKNVNLIKISLKINKLSPIIHKI